MPSAQYFPLPMSYCTPHGYVYGHLQIQSNAYKDLSGAVIEY